MNWRALRRLKTCVVLGLFSGLLSEPVGAGDPGQSLRASRAGGETVKVLDAQRLGMLAIEVHGTGAYKVQVQFRNQTQKQLKVILPPGLVAMNDPVASPVVVGGGGDRFVGGGQLGGGRILGGEGDRRAGGGVESTSSGGGFQNMGLGSASNQSGGFGQYINRSQGGLQAMPPVDPATGAVLVPAGQAVSFGVPAVCLNFHDPAPTPANRLRLVDVDEYSSDPRVRKSLRTLATLGTSMGMAQATMWQVCNGVPFEQMLARNREINDAEAALATRFIQAIDGDAKLSRFDVARVFLTITADAHNSKLASRLVKKCEGQRLLGMPFVISPKGKIPQGSAPIIHLGVTLGSSTSADATGRVVVQVGQGSDAPAWSVLGQADLEDLPHLRSLDAAGLIRSIDRAVATSFVTVKPTGRAADGTTLEIQNRLPFTLAKIALKGGDSDPAPPLEVVGLGVGPGRKGQTTLTATLAPSWTPIIERVELNGL